MKLDLALIKLVGSDKELDAYISSIVYPVHLPEGSKTPALVIQINADAPMLSHDGVQQQREATVVFNAISDSNFLPTRIIGERLWRLLHGFTGNITSSIDANSAGPGFAVGEYTIDVLNCIEEGCSVEYNNDINMYVEQRIYKIMYLEEITDGR